MITVVIVSLAYGFYKLVFIHVYMKTVYMPVTAHEDTHCSAVRTVIQCHVKIKGSDVVYL